MRDFFETVRHRHSVRRYRNDAPVSREGLHAILETACAAPSAGDLQAYHIYVISESDRRDALARASRNQDFVRDAPVCLVFCADSERSAGEFGERGAQLYAIQDATIAATYAQLAVVAAGMGSTWVGEFDSAALAKLLNMPAHYTPVAMLSIGYAAELPEPTPRRRLDELVTYD